MFRTGHGPIGNKLKGEMWNSSDKKTSKGSNIKTGLIGYVTQDICEK